MVEELSTGMMEMRCEICLFVLVYADSYIQSESATRSASFEEEPRTYKNTGRMTTRKRVKGV